MATDRPVSAVLRDIVGNVQDIVRSELRLAKTEATEELGKSRDAALWVGLGVLMFVFSLLFGLVALMYALSQVMPVWAAALSVAALEGGLAAVLLALGMKRFRTVRGAPRTIASLKENVEWARQQTRWRRTSTASATRSRPIFASWKTAPER